MNNNNNTLIHWKFFLNPKNINSSIINVSCFLDSFVSEKTASSLKGQDNAEWIIILITDSINASIHAPAIESKVSIRTPIMIGVLIRKSGIK